MKQDRIIEKIELYYQQYLNKKSYVLFNLNTINFMQKLQNIPFCKDVFEQLKKDFPFSKEKIESVEIGYPYDKMRAYLTNDERSYFSFCLHWYEYRILKNEDKIDMNAAFKKCKWLNSSIDLFKSDFIRPLLDYVILQLKEDGYIIYQIKRYARRISNFRILTDITTSKTCNDIRGIPLMNEKELDLHQDLCLFLYDNEIDFGYSETIGNAEVDFKLPQCNKNPYVIEVKIYKGEKDLGRIKDGTKQLKDYMNRMDTRYGCIFIYSQTDDYFIADESLDEEGIRLVSAYIGGKSPSKRSKTGKTIKVGFGTIECKCDNNNN